MNNLESKIQQLLGITKNEITFVSIILIGLLIGLLIKLTNANYLHRFQNNPTVYSLLDSIAEIRKTTFIGVDASNQVDVKLVTLDTSVKDEKRPFQSKKKELPKTKININTASKSQLMTLPGVGEKTADLIIEFRKKQTFRTSRDLMKVKGIGIKKYEKMAPYITTN